MKVSSRGRYALRMMIDIAENSNGSWIAIKDISARQGISIKYLEQIVTHLTRAKLLRSGRGAQGGYMLTREPKDYTAGEIIRAVEGGFAPVACLADDVNRCERASDCQTLGFWEGLYALIDEYMDSVLLQAFVSPKEEEA